MKATSPFNRTPSTRRQLAVVEEVVGWYLRRYRGTADDPGSLEMFSDPERVGAFAVDRSQLAAGAPSALFKLLVAVAMFQRQRDVRVQEILRAIPDPLAGEMTDRKALLHLADTSACHLPRSLAGLAACDLTKSDGHATCDTASSLPCHLKRHTQVLNRYGDFGKIPTSAALVVREAGTDDLAHLYREALRRHGSGPARSAALLNSLREVWRIDWKLASMFLSLVANPDFSPGAAPWAEGLDWTQFVVIDSNVDQFLTGISRKRRTAYEERASFVRKLARGVDLTRFDSKLRSYNPRIVQQAIYVFMSVSNRRAAPIDCSRSPGACEPCPGSLQRRCGLRVSPSGANPSNRRNPDVPAKL